MASVNYNVFVENGELYVERNYSGFEAWETLPIEQVTRGMYEVYFFDMYETAPTIDEAIQAYEAMERVYYARKAG